MTAADHLLARLESGQLVSPAGALGRFAQATVAPLLDRIVVRRLRLPPERVIVGVGGATWGGGGKTPLAIACAEMLAERGARVALVGHAYRASPQRARAVRRADPLREVGDEALVAARILEAKGGNVSVVVAERRQQAIDFAATIADFLVLDGVLQTAPVPVSASLLALDAARPWGNGAFPPCGDLRARPELLLRVSDRVVRIGARTDGDDGSLAERACRLVNEEGAPPSLSDLAPFRIGLATFIAHPERLERQLAAAGVVPVVTLRGRDHGSPEVRALERLTVEARIDYWLATEKCRLHLPSHIRGRAVLQLADVLRLPPSLCDWLSNVAVAGRVRAGPP